MGGTSVSIPVFLSMVLAISTVNMDQASRVYFETEITRNQDPSWHPGTYEQYRETIPEEGELVVRTVIERATDTLDFAVILENGLADSIGTALLDQWVADIEQQGMVVEVQEVSYTAPESLRSYLSDLHQNGMEGAVLVGELPVPWSALDNTFLRYGETFPSDYFYMDLDGVWEDEWIGYPSQSNPGQDGIYDTWSGDLTPEIYVGRIKTDNLGGVGDPTDLLRDYLERNHTWRDQGDTLPACGLCYVDDDWAYWGPTYQAAMQELYPNTELINDESQTNGTDYEQNRLQGNYYTWISPYVHSSSQLHQWSPGPSTYWYEVRDIDPQARFYNLFACSNCRFTENNHMGGVYAFGTTAGLASVGSTKSGSMLNFIEFYAPLGEGDNMGQAYQDWWEYVSGNGITPYEASWHLGMVLLGDPTLIPSSHVPVRAPELAELGPPLEIRALPNPSRGSLTLTVSRPVQAEVSVFDTAGRMVLRQGLTDGKTGLDLSGLPGGVYLARLRTAGGRVGSVRLVRLD
ncbi:T9SS type A sorting domain-containing protein [Candidatus Fermentibacteria bacterium]|nr:T9SS type A sorting domain-containing protein [Candidatus Fermentibacteria bacterium]